MKRKCLSFLTALALCLSLLPGTVWAEDPPADPAGNPPAAPTDNPTADPMENPPAAVAPRAGDSGVTFAYQGRSVALADGEIYVADENQQGIKKWTEEEPPADAYLSYNGTTLTVHGAFVVTATITVNSDLTITGEAGSSLDVTASNGVTIYLGSGSVLTLDGGMDFKVKNSYGPVLMNVGGDPTGTFGSSAGYSGDIVIENESTGGAPSASEVALDVQSSKSITISGMISYPETPETAVLNSVGSVSITSRSASLGIPSLKIKGADVELVNNGYSPVYMGNSLDITATGNVLIKNDNNPTSNAPAIIGSAVISAGGDVTISSGGPLAVPYAEGGGLTVKNAQSVSISGASSSRSSDLSLFLVPVAFEGCGEVTITDSGDGDILGEDAEITSDCFCTATNQWGEGLVIVPDEGTYECEGEADPDWGIEIYEGDKKCWKAGGGWIFYDDESGTLTLDNAAFADGFISLMGNTPVSIVAKGENRISAILAEGSVTVDERGGSLNTMVGEMNFAEQEGSFTVYGKAKLPANLTVGQEDGDKSSLTIPEGAELTIPSGTNIEINDLDFFTNNGALVNNGSVTLTGDAAENANAETVKSLGLSGGGRVLVETADGGETVYNNAGKQLLAPAGTDGELDLSGAVTSDDSKWDTEGYKWEVVTDNQYPPTITSATLTLKDGFNADTVILPDATVRIETEENAECIIGELSPFIDVYGNPSAQKTKVTFAGTGKLTVSERINFVGGDHNSITVAEDAEVNVCGSICVSGNGNADGKVEVNGTLTAVGDDFYAAINTGKVTIGRTGTLKVSGQRGVNVGGNTRTEPDAAFENAFVIAVGGTFEADCSEYNIIVDFDVTGFPEGADANEIINLAASYRPSASLYVITPSDNRQFITYARPGEGVRYDGVTNRYVGAASGPFSLHEHHSFTEWSEDAENHWKNCDYNGCVRRDKEGTHVYSDGHDAICNTCGHVRTPPDGPDEPVKPGGGGGSGGGGGGSFAPTYPITIEKTGHGSVASSHTRSSINNTITLTVSPDGGCELESLTVTDSQGSTVKLTRRSEGKYTFAMPGRAVTVKAVFASLSGGGEWDCDGGENCPSRNFPDLDTSAWYHEATDYVLKNGLMRGYGDGTFGPGRPLTRAQFVQILYNRAGAPAVSGGSGFSDVDSGAWYANAVIWAEQSGVAAGYSDGTFRPNNQVTRQQLAVMLWRCAGSPAATSRELRFADAGEAGAYALEALRWAAEKGVINGYGDGRLKPKERTTRVQAAQMLMNFFRSLDS